MAMPATVSNRDRHPERRIGLRPTRLGVDFEICGWWEAAVHLNKDPTLVS